ncbi:EthD family reductase [Pseudomonas aeruginosa]|uniref:EthD family reductase n=1 Tax=Pseudomonas aeruginosa TaxID=287 RepID=UPI001A9516B0|nr:EthD family reductase [Pseudomonas aeruginosa]MBO0968694.1 EthD family reductase [Pseudomonas aeruginosa]MCV4103387.1 EthD family reductase [Pseudomonas aeruginosa]MDG4275153.1 EthD family reductase [Pseudomonas aeruginosa]HBO3911206.1 EthD family reductase [Pseudomonas aeruginosa]HCF5874568.1 EthD family reductase [Pseudomonas aeruginosa]
MATLIVSYPLSEGSTFDREYYQSTHIPLAYSAWAGFGLQAAEILFPAAGPQPLAGMVILRFADQAGIDAALTSPKTAEVIGDVANFTNIAPLIFRADD